MKTLSVLLSVFLGVSFLTAAAPNKHSTDSVDWAKAEQRYIDNLRSDNTGVVASAAGYLRKYKLTGAVEELKELLSREHAEHVKMSAALALIRIGGADGRIAVEEALRQEESEIVAEFYTSVLQRQSTAGR